MYNKLKKKGGIDVFSSKYSNVLTVFLVIVIVAIIGLVGFLGYDMYRKYYIDKEAEEFMAQYEEELNIVETNTDEDLGNIVIDPGKQVATTQTANSNASNNKKPTYQGFNVLGTIEYQKQV